MTWINLTADYFKFLRMEVSPSIGPGDGVPLALHRYTFVTPADATSSSSLRLYGCLRKIRRHHYHINRATGTRRTGNLSSSSSMEARSNNK